MSLPPSPLPLLPAPCQTIEFCAHYGLKVGRKPSVLLVRGGMARPEEPLPLRRSPYLVEAKNETCFGEVVYGSPLPPPPTLPPPYCSFTRSREAPPGAREATPPPTCTNEVPEHGPGLNTWVMDSACTSPSVGFGCCDVRLRRGSGPEGNASGCFGVSTGGVSVCACVCVCVRVRVYVSIYVCVSAG